MVGFEPLPNPKNDSSPRLTACGGFEGRRGGGKAPGTLRLRNN